MTPEEIQALIDDPNEAQWQAPPVVRDPQPGEIGVPAEVPVVDETPAEPAEPDAGTIGVPAEVPVPEPEPEVVVEPESAE